jgi:hypothetical protein
MIKALKRLLANRRHEQIIKSSGVFDSDFYLSTYPDVGLENFDPVTHYVRHGAGENRLPNRYFDTAYYRNRYLNTSQPELNPLVHYIETGALTLSDPSPLFCAYEYAKDFNLNLNKDNPLVHYQNTTKSNRARIQIIRVSDSTPYLLSILSVIPPLDQAAQKTKHSFYVLDPVIEFLVNSILPDDLPVFDPKYYLTSNPDVRHSKISAAEHYLEFGQYEFRNPHPKFSLLWYFSEHLNNSNLITPTVDYLERGYALNLSTTYPDEADEMPRLLDQTSVTRRIAFFAGYDVDGIVDQYVVDYIAELSKFADVYYLADCFMKSGELEKLKRFTTQAWAFPHGGYDFGSHSKLAKDLVGWAEVEKYDELLIVNDSCYLLSPLSGVFDKMIDQEIDWWGLQATKGIAMTRNKSENRFPNPLPMNLVTGELVSNYIKSSQFDFHLGSYFLAFRTNVINDEGFRKRIENVVIETNKLNIVMKYEIGLTRYLLSKKYRFNTFVDFLYPFHPVYSNWYLSLQSAGFPLIKKYLFSNNHYKVQRLCEWVTLTKAIFPDAKLKIIQDNLNRTVNNDTLNQNLHIGCTPNCQSSQEFLLPKKNNFLMSKEEDLITPKLNNLWLFVESDEFSTEIDALREVLKDFNFMQIETIKTEDLDKLHTSSRNNANFMPGVTETGKLLLAAKNVVLDDVKVLSCFSELASGLRNIIYVGRLDAQENFFDDTESEMDACDGQELVTHAISRNKIQALLLTKVFENLHLRNITIYVRDNSSKTLELGEIDYSKADLKQSMLHLMNLVSNSTFQNR